MVSGARARVSFGCIEPLGIIGRMGTQPLSVIRLSDSEWDKFVASKGGHLLQTSAWGKLKSAQGWESDKIAIGYADRIVAGALLLFRRLPWPASYFPLKLGYIPCGPLVNWFDVETARQLLEQIDIVARQKHAVFLKIEPDEIQDDAIGTCLIGLGLRPSPQTVQPPNTIVIDIKGDSEMLARMNQGTRRKIRTAEKQDVTIREGTRDDMPVFGQLITITGERDGFGVHNIGYYEMAFDLFFPDRAALFIAYYAEQPLGAIMVFAFGQRAWYLYGASANQERQRMPNYALQWRAIQWARERGCTTYDLWGIPDVSESQLEAEFQQRQDGLWGVYGFKRGFGGRIQRSIGAWDKAYNPAIYRIYRMLVAGRRRADG